MVPKDAHALSPEPVNMASYLVIEDVEMGHHSGLSRGLQVMTEEAGGSQSVAGVC